MEKGYLEIHGDTSEKELKEIKKTLVSAIKSTKSTLPTKIDVISQIQRLANEAISVYETNENKECIAKHIQNYKLKNTLLPASRRSSSVRSPFFSITPKEHSFAASYRSLPS